MDRRRLSLTSLPVHDDVRTISAHCDKVRSRTRGPDRIMKFDPKHVLIATELQGLARMELTLRNDFRKFSERNAYRNGFMQLLLYARTCAIIWTVMFTWESSYFFMDLSSKIIWYQMRQKPVNKWKGRERDDFNVCSRRTAHLNGTPTNGKHKHDNDHQPGHAPLSLPAVTRDEELSAPEQQQQQEGEENDREW